MPATSRNQRVAMAIAEHHPDQLYARNRSMLKMSKKALHEYAATKGLGKSGERHDHTPKNSFAHAGTTREGPNLSSANARATEAGVAAAQEPKAFAQSGTSKPGSKATPGVLATGSAASARPRISRSGEGFATNMARQGRASKSASPGHYGIDRGRAQDKGTGDYDAAREGNFVATDKIKGPKMQQGPKTAPSRAAIRQNPAIARKLNRGR